MTLDAGLHKVRNVRAHIERLRARADFIDAKLEEIKNLQGENWQPEGTYAYRELMALRWAIPVLEAEWDNAARLRRNVEAAEKRLHDDVDDEYAAPRWKLAHEISAADCPGSRAWIEARA